MRHVGRHEQGTDTAREVTEPRCNSDHLWRIRDITFALSGTYITEVCERCCAMHIFGPDELADQPVANWEPDRPWRHTGIHLDDLARQLPGSADQPSSKAE